MFIRLNHRIKRVVTKNWKMKLFLAVITFFAILTIFAYSIPDAAATICYTILGFGLFLECIGFLAEIFDFYNEEAACVFLMIISFILAVVISVTKHV